MFTCIHWTKFEDDENNLWNDQKTTTFVFGPLQYRILHLKKNMENIFKARDLQTI
jgi:hypothetical protein